MQLVRVVQTGVDVDGDGRTDLDKRARDLLGVVAGVGLRHVVLRGDDRGAGRRVLNDRLTDGGAPSAQHRGAAERRDDARRPHAPLLNSEHGLTAIDGWRSPRRGSTRTSRCVGNAPDPHRARHGRDPGGARALRVGRPERRPHGLRAARASPAPAGQAPRPGADPVRAGGPGAPEPGSQRAPSRRRPRGPDLALPPRRFYPTMPPEYQMIMGSQRRAQFLCRTRPAAMAARRPRHAGAGVTISGVRWSDHEHSAARRLLGSTGGVASGPGVHPMSSGIADGQFGRSSIL